MSDPEWNGLVHQHQERHIKMRQEITERMFGTPLPFSRTPRGTIALEWAQVDGRTTYEVDLAPNNDEASAKIASIYRLDEFEVGELLTHTQDVEFPKNTPMVIYQLGGMSNTILNPTHPEGTALEIAAKFWIIGEYYRRSKRDFSYRNTKLL